MATFARGIDWVCKQVDDADADADADADDGLLAAER